MLSKQCKGAGKQGNSVRDNGPGMRKGTCPTCGRRLNVSALGKIPRHNRG